MHHLHVSSPRHGPAGNADRKRISLTRSRGFAARGRNQMCRIASQVILQCGLLLHQCSCRRPPSASRAYSHYRTPPVFMLSCAATPHVHFSSTWLLCSKNVRDPALGGIVPPTIHDENTGPHFVP